MDEKARDELLVREYTQLIAIYESYEPRFLTIKGWSATLGVGGIAGAFQAESSALFLVAASASALFWLIDSVFDVYQASYGPRLEVIEQHFLDSAPDEPAPMQIYTSFWNAFDGEEAEEDPSATDKKTTEIPESEYEPGWLSLFRDHGLSIAVHLPHSLVVFAGIGLFVANLMFPFFS